MKQTLDIGVFEARAIPSTYSGYETFLTALLPALAERGHKVTMYCRPGTIDDELPFMGVERKVSWSTSSVSTSTLTHGFTSAIAARRARHDVVLVVNVANAPFTFFERATGQPVVLNTDGQEWLRGKWGPAGRRVFKACAHIARWSATALISDCSAMAEVYRSEFGAESTVIPYCFPVSTWQPGTDVLSKYNVESGRYIIVGGRHNPENCIDRIVESYTSTRLPHPILVLGTANYQSPVTRRVNEAAQTDDRVRVLGHIGDRQEFFDLLHHAAVYIHGHTVGGMNPSLVEAMRSSAEIAAIDTPFNRETLGPTGEFFSLEPTDTLPATLESMLDGRTGNNRSAAAMRADTDFALAAVSDAYEALLLEASAAGRKKYLTMPTSWT